MLVYNTGNWKVEYNRDESHSRRKFIDLYSIGKQRLFVLIIMPFAQAAVAVSATGTVAQVFGMQDVAII